MNNRIDYVAGLIMGALISLLFFQFCIVLAFQNERHEQQQLMRGIPAYAKPQYNRPPVSDKQEQRLAEQSRVRTSLKD